MTDKNVEAPVHDFKGMARAELDKAAPEFGISAADYAKADDLRDALIAAQGGDATPAGDALMAEFRRTRKVPTGYTYNVRDGLFKTPKKDK